jgi:hypothetical protein
MKNLLLFIVMAALLSMFASVNSAPIKTAEKVVPLEDDASEAVSVATDTAIKMAKKHTKQAIEKVAKGQVPTPSNNDDSSEEASLVKSLAGEVSNAPVSMTGASSTGATGSTGSTGSTGASGATGSGRLWFFAPACNGRGSLHKILKKCICHKKHGGAKCEFKKLRTGQYNHELQKVESHGRYVGVSKCLNGTPMGENDCVCFPGFSGYHCDQKECRNGKMVCANGVKFCQKSTVCRCEKGWLGPSCDRPVSASTGGTGLTGSTGSTGGTGATGSASTGPAAQKLRSVRYQRIKKPAYKQTKEEVRDSIANELNDRV